MRSSGEREQRRERSSWNEAPATRMRGFALTCETVPPTATRPDLVPACTQPFFTAHSSTG